MPLSFPSNPTLNQTYIYSGTTWTFNGNGWTKSGAGAGGATITVSETKPASTTEGSLWLDENTGDVAVYFNGGWAGISGGGGSSGGGGVAAVYDIASTSTGYFDLPSGTTAQRPASPHTGMARYNTTANALEFYGNDWVQLSGLGITSVSPTTFNGNAETVFTIVGSGFVAGTSVRFITNSGNAVTAGTVTINNLNNITATTPRAFTVAEEPLDVQVVSPAGMTVTLQDVVDCGGSPTFTTAAGSLGSIYDSNRTNYTLLSAAATDADGQPLTYSITTGSLPPNMSFNTSTGALTGTPNNVVADTTYTFTVSVTDGINTNARQFSITVRAPIIETFSTAGTYFWTAPDTLSKLSRLILIGAGGGGNSGNGQWAAGGGGGGYANALDVPVTAGTQYTLVVGAKGLGATSCGSNGVAGENTTGFTNIGYGGGSGKVNTVAGAGGSFLVNAGTNSGSTAGSAGNAATGDGSGGGGQNGGGSTYGAGGTGVSNFNPGNHATGNGNGGGGGHSCQNGHRGGGNGSDGYIELRY
jgi:hypothetical protein